MTEAGWLESNKLEAMLEHLDGKVSERKFRLTECAFLRHFWGLLTDGRSRAAVEVAERFADVLANRSELDAVYAKAEAAYLGLLDTFILNHPNVGRSFWGGSVSAAQFAASSFYDFPEAFPSAKNPERLRTIRNLIWIATAAYPIHAPDDDMAHRIGYAAIKAAEAPLCDLLRDLFGNPFRMVSIPPAWRTASVTGLAQAIYFERRYEDLAILADALEDAGCANAAILSLCRQPRPHAKGWWLLDLLLGKE